MLPGLPEPWMLHPAAVHFPIALLTTGLAVCALSLRKETAAGPARWLLYLGTLSAWAALGFGLLAEDTVPHVPAAWRELAEHKEAAYWTVGWFSALSAARFWLDRRPRRRSWEAAFLILWGVAAATLAHTAYHGGELVFDYNVGTKATAE